MGKNRGSRTSVRFGEDGERAFRKLSPGVQRLTRSVARSTAAIFIHHNLVENVDVWFAIPRRSARQILAVVNRVLRDSRDEIKTFERRKTDASVTAQIAPRFKIRMMRLLGKEIREKLLSPKYRQISRVIFKGPAALEYLSWLIQGMKEEDIYGARGT